MARYSLNAPALLHVKAKTDGTRLQVLCHDASSHGAFFFTGEKLDIGTRVEAHLSMHVNAGKKSGSETRHVSIEIAGTVIRQEEAGLAVRFGRKYNLRPKSSGTGRS